MLTHLKDYQKFIPLVGKFSVNRIDHKTGMVIDSFSEKNIIVLDAKEAIIKAISGSILGHIDTIKLGEDVGDDVNLQGSPNITFNDNNPSADTIVRDAGSFIDDGYIEDMSIVVTNTVSNNGTYTIDTVTATTITLIAGDSLTNESLVFGVSMVGTPSLDNPATAVETYDENTMDLIFDAPYTLSVGYPNSTSVTFGVTIIGQDVLDLYPLATSKIITSAALHTNNGNVFSYKRFPQKSISALIDLSIVWEIGY